MADIWQTLEEAALTLGISSRTLHRRIARGEFETRLENGRREVRVSVMTDTAAAPADAVSDGTFESVAEVADMSDASDGAPEPLSAEVQGAMLALQEDRVRRTDLAIMAYQQSVNLATTETQRARFNTRIALAAAVTLATLLFATVIWSTNRVTRAQSQLENMSATVRQLSDTADARQREAEKLRTEAETVRLSAARVEGELAAVRTQNSQAAQAQATQAKFVSQPNGEPDNAAHASAKPSTRPVSLLNYLTQVLNGQ